MLGTYGDWLYNAAGGVLLLALALTLFEQAWGRHALAATAGHRRHARELLAVGTRSGDGPASDATIEDHHGPGGAGGSVAVTPDDGAPADGAPDDGTPETRKAARAERAGRIGVSLSVLAAVLLAGSMVLRGLETGRAPWGNMHEYIAMLCLVGLVTWLVILRRYPMRHLTGFVLLPLIILLFVGGTSLYVPAGPLVPALQSYWMITHVAAAIVGSGILLVPGTASLLYLFRKPFEDGATRFAGFARRLPPAAMLDRLAYRLTIIAFPIFTFGVLAGAIWAEAAWGRYWGWDPKETVAFIMWIVLAAYLHSRATAGWRTTRAAVINVVAFALGIFNLFFVNLVVTGLHSYAGV